MTPGGELGPVLRAIAALAEAEPAREVCGFVLGAGERSPPELLPARNAAAAPERSFSVDPRDVLAALTRAERERVEVIALYHSHPTGGAKLSELDAEQLTGEGIPLLPGVDLWVVGLQRGSVAEVRGYRWGVGGFAEAWRRRPPFDP